MIDRRTLMALIASGALVPGIAFAADRRVYTAKIMLEDNRVLIAVGINGTGPYIFMIDTGTYVSLIRPDLAKTLKLPVRGYERTRGVGGKSQAFAIHFARELVIGGSIRQAGVVLEDSFDFGYRQDIYGALAAGVLTTVDTDLDFDAGELRIYPDGRGERPGYTATDAFIPRNERPERGSRKIEATVLLDGRPIRCLLDTGAPHALMLNQAAARRLGYGDDRPSAPVRPRGIGGAGPLGRVIRVDTIELGGARAERPLVTILGTNAGGDIDGILGLSFIRRFNLSIDTAGRRLWVAPSKQPLVPERYGLAGLWLDPAGDQAVVAAVGTGSPAAKAGLRVGDRIAGKWPDMLRSIDGAPGTKIVLNVQRDGAVKPIEIELAAYL